MRTATISILLLAAGACSDTQSKTDARVDLQLADTRPAVIDQPRVDLLHADARRDGPLPDRPPTIDTTPDLFPSFDGGHPACAKVGGSCTRYRWDICPVGFEPVDPNPHADCGAGWCCTPAPPSTCSAASGVNCVVGKACTGCWGPATNTSLTCEAGRVCCEDICD